MLSLLKCKSRVLKNCNKNGNRIKDNQDESIIENVEICVKMFFVYIALCLCILHS